MSATERHYNVLFVDVTGSVRIYAAQGDQQASTQIAGVMESVAKITRHHQGKVVKSLGDGMICVFQQSDQACSAATDMKTQTNVGDMALHGGLHTGPIIISDGDIFGQTVNITARLCDYAQAGEFVMSDAFQRNLSPALQQATRALGRAPLKGLSEPMMVHQITVGEENLTTIGSDIKAMVQAQQVLSISAGETTKSLTMSSAPLTIGRAEDNSLVLQGARVSRYHCIIQPTDSGFVLSDRSSNGTAIIAEQQPLVLLKREVSRLSGRGTILLGSTEPMDAQSILHYSLGY